MGNSSSEGFRCPLPSLSSVCLPPLWSQTQDPQTLQLQTQDTPLQSHPRTLKPPITNTGHSNHKNKDMMVDGPALPLSTLSLSLLCLLLRGSTASSIANSSAAVTRNAGQTDTPFHETNSTSPSPTGVSEGYATENSGNMELHSHNGTTDPMRNIAMTPNKTDSPDMETMGTSTHSAIIPSQTTLPPKLPERQGLSLAVRIVVVLLVLVMLIVLFLAIRYRWMDRCRGGVGAASGCLAAGVRDIQSRLGIRLWPGKRGEVGGENEDEEEEDDEEEEGGQRWGDVELGNGRDVESEKDKREEEEDDSSDDYSSMEGYDLRERARQEEGVGGEGKREGQDQGEEKKEEGMSKEETAAEKSEEGGMVECDLTAL
ncbi:hypothetical protein AGOR_G00192240 [Albula goreensis]|uniref:Uncharacterized protein n=1 Tax=Albula goreensis TaxID=1534307 RepID=A0A8T3CYC3_9TELE|nr:hypothetical protein AGOR_G00192240 [Albula goreensis]